MCESEQVKALNEWLEGRPESIAELAEVLKPWCRYRVKQTGQHCSLYSYSEDGTVTVTIDGHDNEMLANMNALMPVNVFGMLPDDLEPLDT